MRVRPATEHDFSATVALLEELGRAEVTEATGDACREIFDRQLANPAAEHLVAEDGDGRVVGFCSLHFRERLNHATPQAWVPDLIVRESSRGRGIGRALLAEAERRARERGCWSLTLESGYERTEAHRLYEAAGMTDAGKYFGKRM